MDSSNARRGSCSQGFESWRNRVSDADQMLISAITDDRRPPDYTPMSEGNHVTGEPATCCAFLNFNLGVRDVFEHDCLLEQYHKLAFLSWVARERRPAQNIPNLERLSCPLLWCRKSFDDHDKLVNHVSTCSYLEQGEYWCPYHQQAEQFSTKHPRKQFFRGAVNALRKLGSKSIRKAIHPSKSRSSRDARWSKQQHGSGYDYEDDVAEMDQGDILELDGCVSESMANGGFGHPRHEVFAGYMPAEIEDVKTYAAELDSDNLSLPPMEWETTGVPTPDSALSPISPVTPADQWQTRSFNEPQSPISPTEAMASTPWATHSMLLTKVDQPAHEKQRPNFSYQASKLGCAGSLPEICIDTSLTNLAAYMWQVSTDDLPPNSESGHEDSDSHHNTEHTQQIPPTSGTADTNIGSAMVMNNFEAMQSAGAQYSRAYRSPYQPEELNPPAMQPSEHEGRKRVMRETITEPLITQLGLEGFIPVVRNIHRQLFGSSKIGLRGLQLQLLSDGMMCAGSRHLCDMFIDTVMDLCNQAVNILGEEYSPEGEQCRRRIDVLLQHYHEAQPARYEINAPEVDLSPYASNHTSHSLETPASAGSSEPFDNYWPFGDPSNDTGASTSGSVSPQDLQLNIPAMAELDNTPQHHNTGDYPPQSDIQAPPAACPSRLIPSAAEAELACDECPQVLRGKTIWLSSNMARHKREKHSDQASSFPCAECGRTFSRNHNRKAHVKTVHFKRD